eukprot:5371192-Lingulodinium_polyedra.AAC.1
MPGEAPNWEMARFLSGRTDTIDGVSRELRAWAVRHAKEEVDISAARQRGRVVAAARPARSSRRRRVPTG